jgi:hypothetical protein
MSSNKNQEKSKKGGNKPASGAPGAASKAAVEASQQIVANQNAQKIAAQLAAHEATLRARPTPIESGVRLVESAVNETGVAQIAALDRAWLAPPALQLLPYAPHSDVPALQLMNRDLALLLSAPHHVFWSNALLDASLARFLDAYLRFAARPYEAQALRAAVAQRADSELFFDVAALECKLLDRVFRLLVRLAARKEAEHLFLSKEFYQTALLDANLVSVPMLFDIAAIYGQCAPDTVAQMITGWFGKIPALVAQVAEHWPLVADALRAASKRATAQPFNWAGAVETVSFVHDIMHAVRAFCLAYEPALASLSDDLLVLMAEASEHASTLAELISAGPVIDDDDDDDGENGSNGKDAAANEQLAQRQAVLAERCVQHATAIVALSMRAQYWTVAVGDDGAEEVLGVAKKRDVSRQQAAMRGACSLIVRLSRAGRRALLLQKVASVDDFQDRLIDLHMAQPGLVDAPLLESALAALRSGDAPNKSVSELVRERSRLALRAAIGGGDDDNQKWQELEAACETVRQVVPDLGDGFVLRCLEALDSSVEKVVNALLSDDLPPSVAQMSRSTTLAQLANVTVARRELTRGAEAMRTRMAVYGDDEFDVLGGRANATIDEGRIFRGKREIAIESKRERLETSFHDQFIEQLYADEYDDSFDSFAPGVADSGGGADDEDKEETTEQPDKPESADEKTEVRGRGAAARGRGGGRGGARTAAAYKYKSHHRKDRATQKRAF